MRRYLLEAITALWHKHSDQVVRTADAERSAGVMREERLFHMLERAEDERASVADAFETVSAVTNRMLDEARRDLAVAQIRVADLERQLAVVQNNFEWARVRLNTVEQERAVLIERAMGARMPVAEITREDGGHGKPLEQGAPKEDEREPGLLDGLKLPLGMFDDMGDQAAAEAGLTHDDTGAVVPK